MSNMREITQFIATMAGCYLFITGLGFMFSTNFYEKMVAGNAHADPVTLNLSGAVHFLIGLSVVITHFHWDGPIEIIVTLVGFAALLKGTALIVVPEMMLKSPKTSRTSLRISAGGFVLLGAFLGYAGFFFAA